jgi:hypothetical protein
VQEAADQRLHGPFGVRPVKGRRNSAHGSMSPACLRLVPSWRIMVNGLLTIGG